MSKRAVSVGLAIGIVAFVFACTIRDVTEVPVGSVVVQPSSATLLEGETRQFTAQAKDGLGKNLPSGAVTWSSDAPSIFSIDGNGNGEALAVGQTTVWASLDGTLGSATVTVEPGPRILTDQASLLFFGNVGGEPPDPIPVQITNSGGGSLGGISATVQYAEGEVTGWLSLALAGTSAPTTLTVSVLIGLLDEGTYNAEVTLVSQEARNAPFSIPVQVVVTLDQPIIGLNPRTLQFQGESGGDPPPAQTVQITNLGGGVLSDLQVSALYFGVGGWLTTDLAGVTAPTGLLIQPDPADLSPGTYNAEVRVTGPGALNTPQSVLVTLSVTEAQQADAEVQKTGPDVGSTEDLLVYVLTVSNAGPGTARNVLLMDSLPVGVDFVDASGEGAHAAGVVTWNLGNLPPGTSSVDSLRARATTTGSPANVARITSSTDDPQEANDRAVHRTTITGPDLAVTKSAPSSAAAGDRITYTLLARNLGPVDAEGVLLTDTLPPGVTFVSATGGGSFSAGVGPNGVVRWDLGNLTAAEGSRSFETVVDIGAGTTGILSNVAGIEPTGGDPTRSNNRDVATTSLGAAAELVVGKSAPETGVPGTEITYTVTIQNSGPSDAAGVVLTDTLPPGVTFVSATGGGIHDSGAGVNGVVTWNMGTLTVGAGALDFDVVVGIGAATTGAVVNTAAASSTTPEGDLTNNRATATTTVSGSDLVVGKTAPATATPGQQITYTLTVQNSGPSAATGVVLTDTLPAEVTFLSASGGGTHADGIVTWSVGDLTMAAGSQSRTVTVEIGAGISGPIENVAAATSTSTDPDLSDNHATATTDVQISDLSVEKAGPGTAAPGAEVGYTLTVANLGPSDATDVIITDTLPAGATFVSATGGGTEVGGVVTWNVPTLSVAVGPQVYTVTLVTDAGASGTLRNAAAVRATQLDTNPTNNLSTSTASLVPSSDVSLSKTGPGAAVPGSQITYAITVQNLGPSDATGVRIKDLLPGSVTFVSASGGGVHHPVGDSVIWNVGGLTVASGPQVFNLVVDIKPETSGSVTNPASVSSTTVDTVPGNNDASWSTSVSGADLVLTKSAADDGTPTIGEQITYTLQVRNEGPSTSAGIVLKDTLPATVALVSASGIFDESGGVLTWSPVATLASGSSFSRTVVVSITGVGTIRNAADVTPSASTPDYVLANNHASVTTTALSADVSVAKSVSDDGSPAVGEQVTYTVEVQNAGPSDAAGVVVTDVLPAGVSIVSATQGTYDGGTITWDVGTLTAGAGPQTMSIVAVITTAGTATNTVTAASATPDPNTANNQDQVTITAASLSPANSTATMPATGDAGVPVDIAVQARDSNGAPMSVGGATVVVSVTGSNTATPAVSDVGDGTYTATYTPTAAGTDNVAITMNGTAISGSPFARTVTAGGLSPGESTATMPATGEAGVPVDITVQARDAFGNAITEGGATVVVNVTGSNTAAPAVSDVGDGTYTATYTPTTAGTDNVAITMDGTAINGSPFSRTVTASSRNPATSTASVPATGSAGTALNITVQARDAYGNAVTTGGATVVVSVTGSNTANPAVSDVGDGTYTASYTPTAVGTDDIAITMDGTAIDGSPFSTTVDPGEPSPDQSTATVPATGDAGVPVDIAVQARDAYGNTITTGGAAVVVNVTGSNTATPAVSDVGDGTYTATYTPTVVGTDNVAITMGGTPINGSPFSRTVTVGTLNPATSTANVPATGTAGTALNITVQARDAYGNAITEGGATVVVDVTGANTATPAVSDLGNGTYTASYTPTAAGTDNVAITMDGTSIDGSPFSTTVDPGELNPGSSTANVPAGTAGSATNITVQARDAFGNPLNTGGAVAVVSVSGANNVGSLSITDNDDGTYSASYTPTNTGDDTIVITLEGIPISGSPFTSTVSAGAASPTTSTATVPEGTAGSPTDVQVRTFDEFGNPLDDGGDIITGAVSGANEVEPNEAADGADGTYIFSYTPTQTGIDDVAIALNGTPINGSPFESTIDPGPVSPSNSTADVPDGVVGNPTEVVVQARDTFGNPLTVGGETVVVTPPTGAFTATDEGDGTYTGSYIPTKPGNDLIGITMNGTPISGSPFTSKVDKKLRPISALEVSAYGTAEPVCPMPRTTSLC